MGIDFTCTRSSSLNRVFTLPHGYRGNTQTSTTQNNNDLDLDTDNTNTDDPELEIADFGSTTDAEVKDWVLNIKDFVELDPDDEFASADDVIQYYLALGLEGFDEEMAAEVAAYFTTFDKTDEAKIALLMEKNGLTRAEAIKAAKLDENNAKQTSTSELKPYNETDKTEKEIEKAAEKLYKAGAGKFWGTNEEIFNDILTSGEYSEADIVAIIAKYTEKYGSFSNALDSEFSGVDLAEMQNAYVNALITQAEAGDPKAIELLCKEINNSTVGRNGTSDDFIKALFDTASDEMLELINEHYNKMYGENSLYRDIDEDVVFSGKYTERL